MGVVFFFFFFFQAEDGIRDFHVTGVQTCALPIWGGTRAPCKPFHRFPPATLTSFRPSGLSLGRSDSPPSRFEPQGLLPKLGTTVRARKRSGRPRGKFSSHYSI